MNYIISYTTYEGKQTTVTINQMNLKKKTEQLEKWLLSGKITGYMITSTRERFEK